MPALFSDLVDRAAEYAAVAHRDQLRKSPQLAIPYFHHPVMVGLILQRAGFDDEVVAAGILHDVLEDTPVTYDELVAEFGPRVADLVDLVSEEDKTLPWETRKDSHLERLRAASADHKAIAAADKIHNVWSILRSVRRGEDIWAQFKRGRAQQIERFDRMVRVLGQDWRHPILDELAAAVDELRRAPG